MHRAEVDEPLVGVGLLDDTGHRPGACPGGARSPGNASDREGVPYRPSVLLEGPGDHPGRRSGRGIGPGGDGPGDDRLPAGAYHLLIPSRRRKPPLPGRHPPRALADQGGRTGRDPRSPPRGDGRGADHRPGPVPGSGRPRPRPWCPRRLCHLRRLGPCRRHVPVGRRRRDRGGRPDGEERRRLHDTHPRAAPGGRSAQPRPDLPPRRAGGPLRGGPSSGRRPGQRGGAHGRHSRGNVSLLRCRGPFGRPTVALPRGRRSEVPHRGRITDAGSCRGRSRGNGTGGTNRS